MKQCNVMAVRGASSFEGVSWNSDATAGFGVVTTQLVNSAGLIYDQLNNVELGWLHNYDTCILSFSFYLYGGYHPPEDRGTQCLSGIHNYGFHWYPAEPPIYSHWHFGDDAGYAKDLNTSFWTAGRPVTNVERDDGTDLFNGDSTFTSLKYWSSANWHYWESWGCFSDDDPAYQNSRIDNSATTVRVRREVGGNC